MAKKKIKITAAAIRRAADGKSYKRGENYFRRGMVYSLLTDGDAVAAKVRGTRNYRVRLWAEDGEVEGECSCPMGDAGVFCKHLVAAGLSPILERLQELHHAACLKAKPEPEALAKRLFKWEIESGWDTFYGAAETYADVLGENGLAVYRKLAEKLWDQMPQLGPGDRRSFEGPRFRITSIMEALARASGDIEQLVAVKARDLSSAYRYLDIAETYKQAKQADKALEWAEKGLKAFAEKDPDGRLEDFLADEYHRRRRHDEAMALIWNQFCRRMELGSYQHLKQHAERAKQWPHWREKALSAIRSAIEEQKRESASKSKDPWQAWRRPVDHSVLVQIYLWERDIEAAWQEAQAGGCSDALWMKLAGLREKDHPADAVEIYQRQIDLIVNIKKNDAYREAAKLIRKIQKLMARLGREDEFPPYLESVRKTHKPKRNFMAMLKDM